MELINLIQHRPRPGWNLPWFDIQFSPHSSPFVIGSDLFREHVRRSTGHDPFFIIFPFWQFWWLKTEMKKETSHRTQQIRHTWSAPIVSRSTAKTYRPKCPESYFIQRREGEVLSVVSLALFQSREGPLDVKGTISLPHSGLILLVLSGRIIGVNRYDPIKVVPQTCQTWNTSSINAYRTRIVRTNLTQN